METSANKSTAMLVHLSTFGQWIIPFFGSFIFPLILWSAFKKESRFIDHHGRQALNFQLSIFTYILVLALIGIPIFIFTVFKNVPFDNMVNDGFYIGPGQTPENISGIVILGIMAVVLCFFLKVAEFFLVIYAAVKAVDGVEYRYPLCIPYLSAPHQPQENAPSDEIQNQESETPSNDQSPA